MEEDYDKQIQILQKTRGVLQIIKNSTQAIHKDIETMRNNNASINKASKKTLDLVKDI